MIRINQLKLSPDHSDDEMYRAVKRSLKLDDKTAFEYKIVKQSVDARHKPEISYVYAVNVKIKDSTMEHKILNRINNKNIMSTKENEYIFPYSIEAIRAEKNQRPVIVGFGPAGMFAALSLARLGLRPIVIERGQCVEERIKTVESFWQTNELDTDSNVQFGEGGAGTFSDGKLNTMIKDPSGRIKKVLETFVEFGADSSILYVNKPHIGTDVLCDIVKNMRQEIIRLGGEIRFQTCLNKIIIENHQVQAIMVSDNQNGYGERDNQKMTEERDNQKSSADNHNQNQTAPSEIRIECDTLILAIGHSARDTFSMIYKTGIDMVAKSFAVGLRIEHPQSFVNHNAYGKGEASYKNLPVADYKVTYQASTGRGVYSFCMCPGGYVVNASSEKEMLAVNGMSYSRRDSENANSALIVTVTPEDFEGDSPLAGMEFQRKLERAAYREGHGNVPVQLVADFKENRISSAFGTVIPCIKGNYEFANLRKVLPDYISETIIEGMDNFDSLIKGYNMKDAVFSGVESRTSSPVRILRDENGESSTKGLYPCGEGAGYAGGITSAAIDGIKISEKIAQNYIN